MRRRGCVARVLYSVFVYDELNSSYEIKYLSFAFLDYIKFA